MTDDKRYEFAKKKVQALKDFYIHLLVYILVNAGLIIINLLYSQGGIWFIYPLLGWGIGIVVHGLSVFGSSLFFGEDWEKQQIDKYMNKK